jgi:hypothetical protein
MIFAKQSPTCRYPCRQAGAMSSRQPNQVVTPFAIQTIKIINSTRIDLYRENV